MVIMYANFLVYWRISLQTGIALSTAEVEYIVISCGLREVLPLMKTMEEIIEVLPLHISKPNLICKVHKDNRSCIKMANGKNLSQTKSHFPEIPSLQNACTI